MKILLDENLPKKLKQDLQDYQVFTVREQGPNGKTNGDVIQLMIAERFDVLITFDKNLEHQQNFSRFAVPIFVLNAADNTYLTLKQLVPKIKQECSQSLKVGVTEIRS